MFTHRGAWHESSCILAYLEVFSFYFNINLKKLKRRKYFSTRKLSIKVGKIFFRVTLGNKLPAEGNIIFQYYIEGKPYLNQRSQQLYRFFINASDCIPDHTLIHGALCRERIRLRFLCSCRSLLGPFNEIQ